MKQKQPITKGYIPIEEEKPIRQGTYRVLIDNKTFTSAWFDGKDFEVDVTHWSDKRSK